MKFENMDAIIVEIDEINENIQTLSAEAVNARIAQVTADVLAINKQAKQEAEEKFANIAIEDTNKFWDAFLSDRSFTVYGVTLNAKSGLYDVKTSTVSFPGVDKRFKEMNAEKTDRKTIATDPKYFRTLSHLTHNLITAMKGGIESATSLTLNEKCRTEIAGVDFTKTSIGGMELQANALISCLMPTEIIGETKLRKADIRHLIDICDVAVKVDYGSEKRDAHIKVRNENAILNEIISIFTMRKFGGEYILDSRAKAHRANKKK